MVDLAQGGLVSKLQGWIFSPLVRPNDRSPYYATPKYPCALAPSSLVFFFPQFGPTSLGVLEIQLELCNRT